MSTEEEIEDDGDADDTATRAMMIAFVKVFMIVIVMFMCIDDLFAI